MALARSVALDDKYTLDRDRIYLSGTQALARLPMVQRRRDAAAGLSTAGYVSGYRGSPLGGLDLALWQAAALTARYDIVFRPGVNEELAATAIWGTQQANAGTSGRHDGVFALWYGKGPGVDRSGDAFKHGNAAGSARHGGVLLVAGDDHLAKSSTLPHQSDYGFIAAGIPVLVPSGIDEFVSFGVFGWAMSRFSGCWVGFRAVAAIAEGSASVDAAGALAMRFAQPEVALPPGGLHIRLGDDWNIQEARLHEFKLPAALAFARANAIDRTVLDGGAAPRLGLLTGGKSFPDVMEALDLLGIDAARAGRIGLRLRKLGLAWPLEPEGLGDFADGIEEILVVEEKRPVIEAQVKERLYGRANAPRVLGKRGADGAALLPVAGELDPLIAAPGDRTQARRPRSRGRDDRGANRRGRDAARAPRRGRRSGLEAHALFLLRLPAQHLDPRARGQRGGGRHRLPHDGGLDGPQHRRLHADGRRGGAVGRHGAVHHHAAHLPEYRRRHLFPFRHPRDPPGGRGRREHHLQAALQRCRGDDRRPEARRHAHRPPIWWRSFAPRAWAASSSSPTSRSGMIAGRLAASMSAPRRSGRGAARAARDARRHRHRL